MVEIVDIGLLALLAGLMWSLPGIISGAEAPDFVTRWRERRHGPQPLGPPLEELAVDLRRLLRERDVLLRGSGQQWQRAHHLRACELAIRDRAEHAARALELPPGRCSGERWTVPDLARRIDQLSEAGLVLPENAGLDRS